MAGVTSAVLTRALLTGLMLGAVYALMSMGFNLSLGVMRVVHFAHGALMVWAMYGSFFLYKLLGVDPYLSLPLLALVGYGVGYLLQLGVVQRVMGAPEEGQILFALGLLLVVQNLAQFAFGADAQFLRSSWLQGSVVLLGVRMQVAMLVGGVVAAVTILALHLFLTRTDLGRALRGCADNRFAAPLVGLDVKRVYAVAAGLSGICAAVAGIVLATLLTVSPDRGFELTVLSLVIVIVGGLGNMMGSLVGGLLIGLTTAFSQVLGSALMADAINYAIVVGLLLVKPTGLLGARTQ